MWKGLKGLLAMLILLLMFPVARPVQAAYEELFIQVKAASWAIYVRAESGLQAICSASAFRSGATETMLITAGHCFTDVPTKTDFLVTQDHFTFIPATLKSTGMKLKPGANRPYNMNDFEGDDWAIVIARIGNKPIVPIGTSKSLRIGEDLLVVGLPFGMDFFAVQGIVGSTDMNVAQLIWNHYYGANMYIAGGNSGSGVVSTKQKAIIGILVAAPGAQSSLAIFTPIDIVPWKI